MNMKIHSDFNPTQSQQRCLQLRKKILDMSQKVTALHIGSAYSCMEITETIYFNFIRFKDDIPYDTFIMSKGHGCLAQYTSLAMLNVLKEKDLDEYCTPQGILGTHPDYGNPGIEASTGSLGHGLAISIGMAHADKITKSDRNIFVVLSDGELQEGSVWEAILLAPALKLNRLVVVVDVNDFQSLGRVSVSHPNFYPLPEKMMAFGWECMEVKGHSSSEIYSAIKNRSGNAPFILIARTTKGKGVKFMENVPIWHYRSPSPEEYKIAMSDLEEASK